MDPRNDGDQDDGRQVVDYHTTVVNSIHERTYWGGRRAPTP